MLSRGISSDVRQIRIASHNSFECPRAPWNWKGSGGAEANDALLCPSSPFQDASCRVDVSAPFCEAGPRETAMHDLTRIITARDAETRNQSLDAACAALSHSELLQQCGGLDLFRRRSENLYERVRALFF